MPRKSVYTVLAVLRHPGALDATPGAKWFVLDASSIPFIDSTAVAVLLGFSETLKAPGGNFAIARANGRFREVLERAGVVDVLTARTFYSTPVRAVAAMRALSTYQRPRRPGFASTAAAVQTRRRRSYSADGNTRANLKSATSDILPAFASSRANAAVRWRMARPSPVWAAMRWAV